MSAPAGLIMTTEELRQAAKKCIEIAENLEQQVGPIAGANDVAARLNPASAMGAEASAYCVGLGTTTTNMANHFRKHAARLLDAVALQLGDEEETVIAMNNAARGSAVQGSAVQGSAVRLT